MQPIEPHSSRPEADAWLPDDRYGFALAALMWVLIALMILPEGLDYGAHSSVGAPAAGGAASRILWLALLASSSLIIVWRGGLAWLLLRTVNPFLLVFVALAIVSVGWSIDPGLSARRLVRLITIVLACIAFVLIAWHARRFQSIVRPALSLVLLGSIVFGLVFPEYAIHRQTASELAGAWRGLANHKNGLGALACLSLIFWCHAWLAREVGLLPALVGGAIAAACLILSRSSTSLAASIFALVFLAVSLRAPQALARYVPTMVVVMVGILLLYSLAILGLIPGSGTLMAPITALTGKDTSLTGRTEIWAILSDHISLRPFFGSGYAAYWTPGPVAGTESYEFVRRMGSFYPGSAHNGYLEIVNDLGWAGLVCLFAYVVSHVRQSLQLFAVDRSQATLYLAVFFQQAITNLSETHWFGVLSVDFVLMTLTTTALARSVLEHRLRAAYGEPVVTLAAPPPFLSEPTALHVSRAAMP